MRVRTSIVLRRAPILIFLSLIWFLPAELQAQQSPELQQRIAELEELQRNPLFRQLMGEREQLSPEQKSIMDKAVQNMPLADVKSSLKRLGNSIKGSELLLRQRLKIALGIAVLPELPAPRKQPRISIENASEGEYLQGAEDGHGLLKLEGRIKVTLPEGSFTANRVLVDTDRQEIYGEGEVEFKSGNAAIKAERILYNKRLGTGIIYNAAGYAAPVYIIGKSLQQIGNQRFSASHAWFTTNAADIPHYHFTARRLWVYEDNTVFAVGVWYHIGGVPLLPLPFLYSSNWGTGIISQIGHSDTQGWYWENTYQFGDPEAIYSSSWIPMAYRFKADWHQRVGEVFGIEFFRFSPNLNYFVDVDVARYKRYEVVGDFREKDNIEITNQVTRNDGTIGEDIRKWTKIFALVNFRMANMRDNNTRSFQLRYEDYSHPLFDYEFGGRYAPESTSFALYQDSEASRGLIHSQTDWNAVYTENRGDLSIRVAATRRKVWEGQTNFYDDSQYIPVSDTVPEIDLGHSWDLGTIPVVDMPIYWDHNLHTDLQKTYSEGKEWETRNNNQYETAFRSYYSFYPYFSFEPKLGYGAQKTVPESRSNDANNRESLELQARKNSYQYWFTEDTLTIGPEPINLAITRRFKDSYKEEQNDAPVVNITGFTGNQKVNETELLLTTRPFWNTEFSVNAIYDHREFQDEVESRDRWSYPIFRSDIYLDFLNLGRQDRENLLSRNKIHFLGLRLTDEYVYDPIRRRDHSNVAGLSFEMGGFDLWLLKRLRYLELSYYWYHVYYNTELDHMRFSFKTDIQLWSWGYLEMELDSRATEIERYSGNSVDDEGRSNHVNFSRDIVNGAGLNGREARENAVFNTHFFRTALILDIEDFEYRFGYEMEQKQIYAASTSLETITYYDNRVFFSLTFLKFDVGGGSNSQSRFIFNRQRVRSEDVGTQPIRN